MVQLKIFLNKSNQREKIYLTKINSHALVWLTVPERVLPGNLVHEILNNDRIVGGINEESSKSVKKFYQSFTSGKVFDTNSQTAELVKLTENAFRDVNIAFANELSMLCENKDINVFDAIELANKHPRVNILSPGIGVGGHCIPVDPWFIVHSSKKYSSLIKRSREINDEKTKWVLEKNYTNN